MGAYPEQVLQFGNCVGAVIPQITQGMCPTDGALVSVGHIDKS